MAGSLIRLLVDTPSLSILMQQPGLLFLVGRLLLLNLVVAHICSSNESGYQVDLPYNPSTLELNYSVIMQWVARVCPQSVASLFLNEFVGRNVTVAREHCRSTQVAAWNIF